MKYFKYIDNELHIGEISYLEIDAEYYCVRAVFEHNNKIYTTNFIYKVYFLPEGSYIDEQEYLGEEITKEEFDEKWAIGLKPFLEKWNCIKNSYTIGKKINAKMICIYPQGIVCDIGEIFHGIVNYDQCKIKYGSNTLYPGKEMKLCIIGYDENNMWIKMET